MKEYNIEENYDLRIGNFKDYSMENTKMQFLPVKNNYSNNNSFDEYYLSNNKNIIEENDSKFNLLIYKSKKLFGVTFYQIGNLYVFGFINNSSDPLFCLDKKYHYQLIVLFLEIFLAFVGNYYLFRKLELWRQVIYNLLLILFAIIYGSLILLNPGIIIKNQKGYMHTGLCKRCNIYFSPENNVYHCYDCDICVKKLDHHCGVIRKCIT